MQCNASYARLFLEGFLYAWLIDMQPICTSMLAKILFLQKVGVIILSQEETCLQIETPLLSRSLISGAPRLAPTVMVFQLDLRVGVLTYAKNNGTRETRGFR
jgi:hypothetical protein